MSGMPPVATITSVGLFCHDLVGLDIGVEMYGDAEPLQLLPPPVDDADEVLAPARAGRDQHLPAELAGRLEEHDLVAPLGADPRRFEPGGPAADHDDLPASFPARRHDVRPIVLSRPVDGLCRQEGRYCDWQ